MIMPVGSEAILTEAREVGIGGVGGGGELWRAITSRLGLAHRDGVAHGLGPELAHRGGGASGAWSTHEKLAIVSNRRRV